MRKDTHNPYRASLGAFVVAAGWLAIVVFVAFSGGFAQ